jgi:hypothetical protein
MPDSRLFEDSLIAPTEPKMHGLHEWRIENGIGCFCKNCGLQQNHTGLYCHAKS